MTKIIDSQSLEPVNKALGIAGSGDSQTELLDGSLDQVLDVGPIARRGRTLAGTEGIFRIVLRNIHAAAGDISSSLQPYGIGETGLNPPFPNPIPDSMDFWFIGASIQRFSGSGGLNLAAVRLTNVQQGFGIDSAGTAVVSTSVITLISWNSNEARLAPAFGLQQSLNPFQSVNLRIPRKGAIASPFIVFGTDAVDMSEWDLVMLCGLFPVSLGQDIAI